MVDFRKMISPLSQHRFTLVREALSSFAKLDDKAMASALVVISRSMIDGGSFNPDPRYSYDEWALNRVIPAVARRLDPDLVLRKHEIALPEEADDRLTWVEDMTDERLAECVDSILAHTSFGRGRPATFDINFEMISTHREQFNPIRVAATRALPCFAPLGAFEEKIEPRLEGYYVILSRAHHDSVISYTEDRDVAESFFEHAVALHAAHGTDEIYRLKSAFREIFPNVNHRIEVSAVPE